MTWERTDREPEPNNWDGASTNTTLKENAAYRKLFEEIMRHMPFLKSKAKLLAADGPGFTESTSDIIQGVMKNVLKRLSNEADIIHRYRNKKYLLLRLLQNYLKQLREKPKPLPISEGFDAVAPESSVSGKLMRVERIQKLNQAIKTLNDRDLDLLNRHHFQRHTLKQIGCDRGYSESYASREYKRVLRQLKQLVEAAD